MIAQSGDKLLQNEAIAALEEELIPMAALITPNLPEAAALLRLESIDAEAMPEAARALARFGCGNVLVKGGHLTGDRRDDALFLAGEDRFVNLPGTAIATRNDHGTGCTLSAAIAARLALGQDMETAVRAAKDYINSAIAEGRMYRLGQGHGPVHHFFQFWPV